MCLVMKMSWFFPIYVSDQKFEDSMIFCLMIQITLSVHQIFRQIYVSQKNKK